MIRVGFFALIISLVAGLCLTAWRLSLAIDAGEAGTAAGTSATASAAAGPLEMVNRAAATARVQQAAIVAESYAARNGSYAGVSTESLHVLDPTIDQSVVVTWASESGYCVQAAAGNVVAHAVGPVRTSTDGPCP